MAHCEVIERRWAGQVVVVAASGPSLSAADAATVAASGLRTVAVSDAYLHHPTADILYACDESWWRVHEGVRSFAGERWSSHDDDKNKKFDCADRWGLRLIKGRNAPYFSANQAFIHYGHNSGFQGINLAILLGARRVLLLGFDMHGSHFFGRHPAPLRNTDPREFIKHFTQAAQHMPQNVEVINCTNDSRLLVWQQMPLAAALALS